MSNKKNFNQVILLHPNSYYMMLEDKLSNDFINRKLIPCLNDESISDFNKWILIKQELNMFMKRKTKPFKNSLENQKSIRDEHFNNEINKNNNNFNKVETNENFLTSTPEFQIKKKYKKFYDKDNDMENNTINDFKRIPSKLDSGNSYNSIKKRKKHQQSPTTELNEQEIENEISDQAVRKKKIIKKSHGKDKENRQRYNTRSLQKGESWIKWISLY